MDILFSKLTLFAIAIMMVTAFIVYCVTTIHRIGSVAYFKTVGQICKGIAKALGAFATALLGLLASSTKTSDANEASENAARGGVLNYRTRRFDDGTDAAGWYEKD